MREIKVGVGRDAFEQSRISPRDAVGSIPCAGSFTFAGRAQTFRWNSARPRKFGSFFARFVESLQAEADAEKRNAAFERDEQRSAKIVFIEGADQRGKVPDAGKNQRACARRFAAGVRARRFGAKFVQSAFDASDVARAVVDECDGRPHSSPFVLGRRCEVACRVRPRNAALGRML